MILPAMISSHEFGIVLALGSRPFITFPMTGNSGAGSGLFPKTRWTVIGKLRGPQDAEAAEALEAICRAYWYPLYVYGRRFGLGEADAKDAVQQLFLQMIEGNRMALADVTRGKLRTFLLTAFKNIIGQWRAKMQTAKRGGGAIMFSIDMQDAEGRYVHEVESSEVPPDRAFERKWAVELLWMARQRLQEECEGHHKANLFAQLAPALLEAERWSGFEAAAAALGMEEGAVRVALHRLRKRYRDLLLEEVAKTVEDDADVKEEVTHLLGLFAA